MQEALLAMLVKEPSHGYQLQQRLQAALGPAAPALNPGQVYVTLGRLEKAGLVRVVDTAREGGAGPERKVYELTAAGHARVRDWVDAVSWPRPSLGEFHLKVVLAAGARLADPVEIVDRYRREVLRRLRQAELARLEAAADPAAALLLDGVTLQLDAELRWLDTCAEYWTRRGEEE